MNNDKAFGLICAILVWFLLFKDMSGKKELRDINYTLSRIAHDLECLQENKKHEDE